MIFAIFGPSCVGKTTVTRLVAERLKLPLRSCGGVVRDRASALGVSVQAVPDDVHHEIDRETVAWATSNQPCLLDGRFLDQVLAKAKTSVVLIQLTASDSQRHFRACNSGRTGFTLDDLR